VRKLFLSEASGSAQRRFKQVFTGDLTGVVWVAVRFEADFAKEAGTEAGKDSHGY
jgi:hypothetical protein